MLKYKIITKGGRKSDNIIVLSYNICWSSMNDIIKQKNIISNIVKAIDIYHPDIIGLQEAHKCHKILKQIDLKKYNFIHNKSDKEDMITLWNTEKLLYLKAYFSHFEEGRPFVIILLYDILKNENVCLINLHANHNHNTQKSIFDIINSKMKKIKIKFSRIIMIGDFNRNVSHDKESNYIIYHNEKKFKFKNYDLNKNTCCSLVGYGHRFNYDHIMDTCQPISKIIVNNDWYKKISSDHLMIISKLV